jgi:pimeloyl-ACP methyl ester carboxylesterase
MTERMRQDAVIRKLEIIGEAVKQVSITTKERRPEIPWKQIAGMRDRLTHDYFGVDLALGYCVLTPTLTGLGERSHLARPDIGLDVHISDVINVLTYEDLRDVILLGHSSSGAVITGVADLAPERLAQVVYLDAFVPQGGQAVLDLIAPERREILDALVKTEGDGWLLPRFAPPAWETIVRDMWGVTDDDDVGWMVSRLRPTPVGHFQHPVRRTHPLAENSRS